MKKVGLKERATTNKIGDYVKRSERSLEKREFLKKGRPQAKRGSCNTSKRSLEKEKVPERKKDISNKREKKMWNHI